MRAIVQRVKSATITINGQESRSIGKGFVVYVCVMKNDTKENAEYLKTKICNLRIFSDENDKLNLSLKDVGGEILVVSNFTLSANCRKGNRPSFILAQSPDEANEMYNYFLDLVKSEGIQKVISGEFGADMDIDSICDGPINLIMDTEVIG